MIPKIIHQTTADKSSIHPDLLENVRQIKALNPDWEHRLYDNADCRAFIAEHCDVETLRLYERINPRYGAARADFFRYLLLYRVGGVYLDIKSTVVRPLSSVLSADTRYLISRWDSRPGGRDEGAGKHGKYGVEDEFQQWFIVSEPHHPFLAEVISRVSANIRAYDAWHGGVGASGVLRTTGPIAYTLAVEPLLDHHEHRVVDIYELGFRYSCLSNDRRQDRHRKIIPSYRDIRFPVVQAESHAPLMTHVWHWIAVVIAYLHEASKLGGLRARVVEIKKRQRENRKSRKISGG